ncbi:MAG TPA: S16 family serine protease, partial [Acidimicrobiales bacterium]|nr:S16 family serine protease [Acidimicrobiales bacterium]
PGPLHPRRRRRRRIGVAVAVVALMALATAGATVVKLPYYALAPGSAVEVDPLVMAGAFAAPPSEGRISLLTVRLDQVGLLGAVAGWLDPDVDVVEQRHVLPRGVEARELADVNRTEMDASVQAAVGVAFEALGYDAVTGRGAAVVQVTAGSPAGMALAPGDTIVGMDGAGVTTHYDVLSRVAAARPGSTVVLVVEGDGGAGAGTLQELPVVLDPAPGRPGSAYLGATLATRERQFNFPFPVEIALDGVGGPSAGLAFALEVLDALSPGDLTGGRQVAATGTIELDGSVGAVGGVAQKAAAARRSGVEVLLVPRPEVDQARRLEGGGMAVEAVDNLEEALRVLAAYGGDPLFPAS